MRNIDPVLIALLDTVRKTYGSIPERFRGAIPGDDSSLDTTLLTRVVAHFVPGLVVVDGMLCGDIAHSWLRIKDEEHLIIDLCPRDVYPGPVIVDISHESSYHDDWYVTDDEEPIDIDVAADPLVKGIIEATEGARAFLSLP